MLVVLCLLAISACGGSEANRNIGRDIQQAFLSALDGGAHQNGSAGYVAQFTVYRCNDQNTGVPLDRLTVGDLQSAQGKMLFHCALTETVTGGALLGGSEGWLYYLEVSAGGRWQATWEPEPITAQDVVPQYPCEALCNGLIGHGAPDKLVGDESSGHVAGQNNRTSASATPTTSTSPAGSTPNSPCGSLPETSKMRGLNYLAGRGVSCTTVKKLAIAAARCVAYNHYQPCTIDGFTCKESLANDNLDTNGICTNAQGDKVIYNTAGAP